MLYDKRWDIPANVGTDPWRLALLSAASLIETRGHAKGALMKCGAELCTLGALLESIPDSATCDEAEKNLRDFLHVECIAVWNDAPFRTKREVVSALRACARARMPC